MKTNLLLFHAFTKAIKEGLVKVRRRKKLACFVKLPCQLSPMKLEFRSEDLFLMFI